MTNFGSWLRDARKAAGLTQEELSVRAKCSKSYISMLERGDDHQPSAELVDALADALDVGRATARLSAGYASPMQAYEVGLPLARRLDHILRQAPASTRPKIEDALEQMARTLVSVSA